MRRHFPVPLLRRGNSTVWVLALLAFFAPLMVMQLRELRLSNDMSTWLPRDDAGAVTLAWSQQHFEPENRFLMSWDSSSLADPRVPKLAEQLRKRSRTAGPLQGIDRVVTPHDVLGQMVENGVDKPDAVERLSGVLVGFGPLKIKLSDAGRQQQERVESALRAFVSKELKVRATVLPPVDVQAFGENGTVPATPGEARIPELDIDDSDETPAPTRDEAATDEEGALPPQAAFQLSDWAPEPHDLQLRWSGITPHSPQTQQVIEFAEALKDGTTPLVERAFIQQGAPVALSIMLTEVGDNELYEVVREVRETAIETGIPEEEIRFGGSPIGREALNREAAYAVWNPHVPWYRIWKRSPLGLSAIVGTFLAFLLLRSARLAILVLLVATYTAVAALSLVPTVGQHLNSVLVVMPNLMLVITMSGAIHVANYWRHAANAGAQDPVRTAVQMAREPCVLASSTTAIGLASLLTSVLLPVRQFGIFSAIGCLISVGMVLIAFPALLRAWPGKPARMTEDLEDQWQRLGLLFARHSRLIVVTCLTAFFAAGWGLKWFQTETKAIRYFPSYTRTYQDYEFLEDNLAGIVSVDAIVRIKTDDDRLDRDEDDPDVSQLDLFERMELIRRLQQQLESVPGVTGTLSLADFRRGGTARPQRPNLRYLQKLRAVRDRLFGNPDREMKPTEGVREFVVHASTPLSVVLDGVPFRIERGEEVWRIRAQTSVMADVQYDDLLERINAAVGEVLENEPGADHVLTGTVPLFLRTQQAVLESLIRSFGLAFGIIGLVMMYLLRSVLAGLLTMLPNLLPVVVVFGAISWAGIPVDMGTMITASIALGIAVDGTLHLLTWFRHGITSGLSREQAIAEALGHCAPAMWQTSVCIALGLLMLAFADLLLISRFGWLMAALVTTALIADIVYLPGLLNGLLGRTIEKTAHRRAPLDQSSLAPGNAEDATSPT